MGIFDDLIPADEVEGGLFDDLLPRKEPEKLRATPSDMPEADGVGDIPQDDPAPSSLGMRSAQRQTSLSPQVGGPRAALPAEPVAPEPVVNRGNPDTTDDARAERGFGRSAYLDDGAMPDVQPNAVTRTVQRPADQPPMAAQAATRDDPFEGEGFGSLAKRRGQQAAKGATEVIASVPEALAILDRDITRQRHGSALEAVPALRKEREDLNRIIADTEKDDPRNRAARMRLTNVEGEILRAANMVREDSASLETPVEDTGMFGVGGKIRQSSEDVFGAPDPRDTSFWAGVAEGAGNMTALAGASIIAGPAGLGVGAGLGSSLNSSQIYKEARAAGVDEETALAASRWAGAIGATEIIPISRALKLLPPRLRPKVSNTLMKRFADIAQGSGEEAAQEYLATVANNLVAQKFYDPDRGWDEGAAEGALVGAVLGGGMGLVGSVAGRDGETPASKPPEPQGAPPRPDYGNSPLLTPEDRESPIADDVIGEGKELVDSIVRGETPPRPPQAGVQPLDQGGADVRTPQQSVVQEPSAIDRLSPAPPAQPAPESAPQAPAAGLDVPEGAEPLSTLYGQPQEATTRPALQMPETEDREQVGGDDDFFEEEVDGQPTGRMMRIDPETGGVVPVETQVAPEAVEPQQESNDQARQEPAPQDENVEISAPPAEGPRPTSQSGVVVLENEDLTSIEADPETFQYKSGGDAQGVTDRLTGVRQWDNMKAGQAVVYEYSDGRRVVADGHQRLGLAKRMRGEGQDVAMPVTVLRESEGVTPEDAMVRAAMKNIAEADGRNPDPQQVIDAAKVMRARPDISLEDMNLPTGDRAALGRNAKAVSTLSDDAFGMVVNERASIRSAAAVAKMVPDKAAQANVLDIVEKSGAKNIFEAELVARQAAADTVVQTQDSLFGSESVTESLYVERARVMDRAIKRLRSEASAFKTILKNSGTIEAVGQNRVDADASSKKAAEDAAVQEYITRLANSKGPISDALTEAAKSLKSGGDAGQAVTRFVQAVRSATQDGDAGGAASGASGRADERAGQTPEGQGQDGLVRQVGEPSSNAQSTWEAASKEKRTEIVLRIPGLDDLNRRMLANADWRGMTDAQTAAVSRAISEPAAERTEAGEQQVIPGAEQDATRSESAREADQRREVGARQQQSRMRSAAPQDGPGGLFDTQGDMLDRAEQDEAVSARPDGSDDTSRRYQRRNDTFAAELMSELAANDDIFSYPKAQSNTLEGVFAEIFPVAQYQGEMSPQDITADDPDAEKHLFELPNGEPFFVYRTDDEVWFDVSNVKEGQAGSALYAAVSDYAYNSGRQFIGDPEGLSEIALRRRTDAMLSSALKHGTTEHLAPHAYQRSGDEDLGVPPLEWREGDHLGNIQSLIEVSTESLAHYVPEFRRARYDFSTRTFRNSEGAPVSDEMLDDWSKHPRVREARAGRRTLKRGIILNSLLRAESGDRPGLLEQVSRRGAQPVGPELKGTLYRRGSALDEQKLQNLLPELRKRLDKLMVRNVDLRFDPAMSEQGATEISPNDDIAILIGAALNDVATLNHEVIHVLRARNLFKDGEWSALREAADKEWLKRYNIAERYGDLDREGQIEEAVAEAFADWTQGNLDLTDKAKGPMAKIRRFFKALMETLRGQGITSPADIFKAMEAGDVGARDGAMPADAARKFQRPATAMKTEARHALADATNTATVPDRRIWDEAVRRNGNLLNRAGGAKGAIMDNIDELRVEFQDMMLPLLRAEQAIAAATGQEISKAESAYYAEERYTGRVGRRLDVLREEYTEPMAYMIAQSDAPIKLTDQSGQVREGADAVDLWLTARHAEERNALVQQRDPNMTSGSGMTDAEAQAILKQASGQPFMPVLQRIGDMADQLGKDMIQWREDAGLLSTTEANAWRAMFKHYVPLKGFAETDMYDAIANEPTVRRGRKYNVTGKEAKAITGRSSEAFSPLATMLAMAEEVTVRAEKNLVMQSFYNLATKYPNPAMWKTQDVKTKRVFNRNTGRVETRLMDAAQTNLGPNEIALKISGEEKRIELVDPRLEKALSSVGAVPQFNRITRAASAFSRYFSAVNTMLSPPFVIVNAFRDMITAQFNLGQLPKEIRGKVKKAAVRDWIKAFSGSYQGLGDTNAQGEWAQYFHEFAESGAKVSFFKLELPGARQHEFAKQIKLNTGNKAMRGAKKLKRLNTDDNPVLKVIERLNLAVDNAVRLSVFMEARKQGMTIEEASSLSKNLTVNFNRKGSATAVMNAWFPFFNAAVQGSQVIFKATTHKRVAASVAGATVLGLALDLLNAHLSDEDEDGDLKYDKIPNYIGERNLIIPGPGDSYFTIPLPYGYNAFFYAGQQMGKTMRGVKDTDDAALDTVSAAFAGFSPLSGETVTQTVMPTLGDHLLELATNKDWLGRPIRPENPWDDIGPKSQKMYKNEPPEVYQKVAMGLNALTGGDEVRAGWLDVSPEYLHHTVKFLGGGAGRFADRMIETGTNLARGDTDLIEAHRVPLARVLHYSHGDWLNQGRYFDFKTEVEKADHEYEIKRENGNAADVSEDAKKALRLRGPLKLAEKQRRKLAKEINAVYANPNLTDRQRQDRLEPLYDRRNDIYVTFNKRFIDAMGPQAE